MHTAHINLLLIARTKSDNIKFLICNKPIIEYNIQQIKNGYIIILYRNDQVRRTKNRNSLEYVSSLVRLEYKKNIKHR